MSTPEQRLGSTATAVRRALAARTNQTDLIEDITQETLLRLVSAEQRLDPDAFRAFAIVTARNLLIDHSRSQRRRSDGQHRLVDYGSLTGPEEATLQREETDALADALERLDATDRALLVAHEADGVSVKELASREGTSKGAIAVRLARIRAEVRLEFLLAFRRVELPTPRCRSVLLAVSAGDSRRQERLDARRHLAHCATCGSLSRPLRERRRAIAGWAWLVATAGAIGRAVRQASRRRPVQITAAVGVATIAALGVGGWVTDAPPKETTAPTALAVPPPPPPSPTAAPSTVAPAPNPPATAAPTGSLAVDGTPLATGADLGPYVERTLTGAALRIMSAPAATGFWVAAEGRSPIWVQLVGAEGRTPGTFRAGDVVDLTAVIRHLDVDPAALGITGADAAQLAQAGLYVEAAHDAVVNRRTSG